MLQVFETLYINIFLKYFITNFKLYLSSYKKFKKGKIAYSFLPNLHFLEKKIITYLFKVI
jgi:hypothetical protein